MAKTTHADRVLIGRLGAYVLHSRYDSRELIRPAREAFLFKFEREVDPDGVLDPAERARGGAFIVVPRGTRHLMRAGEGGGRLLTLWTPAGPEALFVDLSRLPADSLRDPEVRSMLSARIDSIPA